MKGTTARLLQQRQRNHLIRYFQLAGDEVALLDYQRNVPIADVLAELTNKITNQQTFSLSLSVRGKASSRQV
jgi:sulfite reductase alpha subunit-like flavoprotein